MASPTSNTSSRNPSFSVTSVTSSTYPTTTILKGKYYEVKLQIRPSPRNNYVYTSYDTLQGTIFIIPRKLTAVTNVNVSLQGFTKTALGDNYNHSSASISQIYNKPNNKCDYCDKNDKSNIKNSQKTEFIDNPLLQSNFSFLDQNLNIECHRLVHIEQDHLEQQQQQQQLNECTQSQNNIQQLVPGETYTYHFEFLIPSEAVCCLLDGDSNAYTKSEDSLGNSSSRSRSSSNSSDGSADTSATDQDASLQMVDSNSTETSRTSFNTISSVPSSVSDMVTDYSSFIDQSTFSKPKDIVFNIHSLTNTKHNLSKHYRNWYAGKRKVLQYHLPPTLHFSNSDNGNKLAKCFNSLFSIVYFLKISITRDTAASGSNNTNNSKTANAYHEIQFLPRESSVDLCQRDKRSEFPINYKTPKLFKLNQTERYCINEYVKSKRNHSNNSTNSSNNNTSYTPDRHLSYVNPLTNQIFGRVDHALANRANKQVALELQTFASSETVMYFELRLLDSDFFTPSTAPQFKIYLVSITDPSNIRNITNESRVAKLVLHGLQINLIEETKVKNQSLDSINSKSKKKKKNLCDDCDQEGAKPEFINDTYAREINIFKTQDNSFSHEIALDYKSINDYDDILKRSNTNQPPKFVKNYNRISSITQAPIYEREIPINAFLNASENFSNNDAENNNGNVIIPSDICPSFRSCNIKRGYKLAFKCQFTSHLDDGEEIYKDKCVLGESNSNINNSNNSSVFTKKLAKVKSKAKARGKTKCKQQPQHLIHSSMCVKVKVLSGISSIIEPSSILNRRLELMNDYSHLCAINRYGNISKNAEGNCDDIFSENDIRDRNTASFSSEVTMDNDWSLPSYEEIFGDSLRSTEPSEPTELSKMTGTSEARLAQDSFENVLPIDVC